MVDVIGVDDVDGAILFGIVELFQSRVLCVHVSVPIFEELFNVEEGIALILRVVDIDHVVNQHGGWGLVKDKSDVGGIVVPLRGHDVGVHGVDVVSLCHRFV